jgi:very-short-patch-repair endonuclease
VAKVALLAGRQHGTIAAWQLIRLGFSRGWIEHQLRIGWLHRLYRGVYAVGHPAATERGRAMAAVLACGPGAHLGIWRAARHWDLLQRVPLAIDVVLVGHRTGPKGVRVHRVKNLHPDERTIRDGIPVTSVPRTLLDLAAVTSERQLRRAANQAARAGWLNAKLIAELLDRHRGRAGMPAFRAVIAAVDPGTPRTRSDLEVLFLNVCARYRLPRPLANVRIEGLEVDFHFPGSGLIVELDGYEYHRTPHEFDQDRRRDAQLKTKGYEVLRVGDQWLNSDPRGVADTVRDLLRRRALPRA